MNQRSEIFVTFCISGQDLFESQNPSKKKKKITRQVNRKNETGSCDIIFFFLFESFFFPSKL